MYTLICKLGALLEKTWNGFFAWKHRRSRRIDLRMLAPSVRRRAPNPDAATAFVMFHVAQDVAWLGASDMELARFLEACGASPRSVSLVLSGGRKALYEGP